MFDRIGLIDYDGKMPNLALMKLSAWYKAQGCQVILNPATLSGLDKVYCSVLFTWNRRKAERLADVYRDIEFGGTGISLHKDLPAEVEACRPDYSLYTVDALYPRMRGVKSQEKRIEKANMLIRSGIGRTTTGCTRTCPHCAVPKKEGGLRQVAAISDLLNPDSNNLILLDNNLLADPDCLDKLHELRDRKIRVSITQGIDARLVTDEIAQALSEVKLIGDYLHCAWDYTSMEGIVMRGVDVLSRFIRASKLACYMLVGYDSTFEEDMHRFRVLTGRGISPYAMVFNKDEGAADARCRHFARWINGRFYKSCSWDEYEPWVKAQFQGALQLCR